MHSLLPVPRLALSTPRVSKFPKSNFENFMISMNFENMFQTSYSSPPFISLCFLKMSLYATSLAKKKDFFCELESQKYMVEVKFRDESNQMVYSIFCYGLSIMSKSGPKGRKFVVSLPQGLFAIGYLIMNSHHGCHF